MGTATSSMMLLFINQCDHDIDIEHKKWTRSWIPLAPLAPGANRFVVLYDGEHVWRHGSSDEATRVHVAVLENYRLYYLDVTPPGARLGCSNFTSCIEETGRIGFNVAMGIHPITIPDVGDTTLCQPADCLAYTETACADAIQFPTDYGKYHQCPMDTTFEIVFCPT